MNARVTVVRATGEDIGTKRDAEAAFDGKLREIGRGFMRTVYVDARGRFVYKVANFGKNSDNESEYARMGRVSRTPGCKSLYSPCALFYVDGVAVLAMRVRPLTSGEVTWEVREKFMEAVSLYNSTNRWGDRLSDMHGGNYRGTPGGRLKLTDCGDVDDGMGNEFAAVKARNGNPGECTGCGNRVRNCVC